LPSGEYSILIKENDGLFVNSFDSQNHLNPIVVKSRGVTCMEIIINYLAAYQEYSQRTKATKALYPFTKQKIQ